MRKFTLFGRSPRAPALWSRNSTAAIRRIVSFGSQLASRQADAMVAAPFEVDRHLITTHMEHKHWPTVSER
jgi:hypothetical protein